MARKKHEFETEIVETDVIPDPEPKPEPKKETLRKVTAVSWYSNGDTETNWRRGEVRYLPEWKIKRLEADLPGNWIYG